MEWSIGPETGESNEQLIVLQGDMDLYDAPRLADAILAHINAGRRNLVMDMAGVDYLDSTGVGVIIRLLQRSKITGGSVRFKGIHGAPRAVLTMSNVISLIKECDPPAAKGVRT